MATLATKQIELNAIHSQAAELAESFLNGNKRDVVDTIATEPPLRGLALLALVLNMLDSDDRDEIEIRLVNRAI